MGAVIRVGWGWGSGVVIASSTLVVGHPGGHCHQGGCIVNTGGVVSRHGCHPHHDDDATCMVNATTRQGGGGGGGGSGHGETMTMRGGVKVYCSTVFGVPVAGQWIARKPTPAEPSTMTMAVAVLTC